MASNSFFFCVGLGADFHSCIRKEAPSVFHKDFNYIPVRTFAVPFLPAKAANLPFPPPSANYQLFNVGDPLLKNHFDGEFPFKQPGAPCYNLIFIITKERKKEEIKKVD